MLERDTERPALPAGTGAGEQKKDWLGRFPRESKGPKAADTATLTPVRSGDTRSTNYQEVKARIHEQLLNRLNLERLSQVKREEAEPELRSVIGTLLEKEAEKTPLSLYERENIVSDVLNELFGLGPLESLLLDGEI